MATDRILTTHTGSLPRPKPLGDLYARRARGESVDADSLKALGISAVADVVARQRDAGVDIVNNGEQTRDSFFLYLRHRLAGLDGHWQRPAFGDAIKYPEYRKRIEETRLRSDAVTLSYFGPPRAVSEVRYVDDSAIVAECEDLIANLASVGLQPDRGFVSVPSPGILAAAIKNEHYTSTRDFVAALGRAVAVEYRKVIDMGLILQIDAPDLAMERHVSFYGQPLAHFLEFTEMVADSIAEALQGLPPDRTRMHVCWGNYDGPHDEDVELRDIVPIIGRIPVGGLVLPFANARHALDFRLLADDRYISSSKIIVAGVIDPLTNVVEHSEVVADRLLRVAEVLGGPERLQAGTDCGFDTASGLGNVAPDVVWAKLTSLRNGAEAASRKLY